MAAILVATFASRHDAYNRWTGSQYVTVRDQLTADVALAAIRDRRPVGGYFLDRSNETQVFAFDLDRPDGWDLACRLGTGMWGAGMPAYVEASVGGRAHVWALLDTMQPGVLVRRAMAGILTDAGLADADHIERRPATDRLAGPDSLGAGLRLPTMPHKSTGERFPLSDPRTGQSLGANLADQLLATDVIPKAALVAAAERAPAAVPLGIADSWQRPRHDSPVARFNAEVGVVAVLGRYWGTVAVPGRTIRCPAHEDRNASLSVARDNARAWCHSPECDLHREGRGVDAFDLWQRAQGGAA